MKSNNRIGVSHCTPINADTTQSKTLCEHFRRRKRMWIIFSIIVLLGLIIIIPIIILKTTNSRNASTTDINETTITITEESTIKIAETTEIRSTTKITTTTKQLVPSLVININTQWKQNASTIAGGNEKGDKLNQLNDPQSIYVDDDDQSIYISDYFNDRIVKWKFGAENGEVVAGGNGQGNKTNQLDSPTDTILDKKSNSLIICDNGNKRVVRWSRGNDRYQQIMIANIRCWGLTMDNNEDLYVSDYEQHEVRRWKQGDTNGVIVAGGNGGGYGFDQFHGPRCIFIDEDYSVYVADFFNARVMKWAKYAKEGILVADKEISENNLNYPHRIPGVIVDHMGNIYMSDMTGCKVTRWSPGAIEGTSVVGKLGCGGGSERLQFVNDLSFDRQGNLYVVDMGNNRVQKFDVQLN